MGGVLFRSGIYDAFMSGPESAIELFHGYTYSGHALAAAAAVATLDLYREEHLFERAAELAPYFEQGVHSLRGLPHVIDLRNCGLMAGIELEPRPGAPGARAFDIFSRCYEEGVLIRTTGDTIALSPPLIVERGQLDQVFETLGRVLREVA
jgi:beta-alanine--pyruvate transaminase